MADTKITNLAAASAAVAGHEFPANRAGTDEKVTAAQLKTLVNTAPVFAAGTSSANSHPKFTSGTLLTTPEDGALEFNGDAVYLTTDDGNRGVVTLEHLIIQQSSRSLSNSASEQKLFDSVTNGTLTLETGTYFFECMFTVTGMSATSGNAAFDIRGAGTAVMGGVLYQVVGIDNNSLTAVGTRTGSFSTTAQGPAASMITAGTGTGMGLHASGIFEISTAGTIIPSITLATASAATLGAMSYFKCNRVGADGTVSVGQWS